MGGLAYDIAHVLGGAMLPCSFLLLTQRRLGGVIWLLAAQGLLLAQAQLENLTLVSADTTLQHTGVRCLW